MEGFSAQIPQVEQARDLQLVQAATFPPATTLSPLLALKREIIRDVWLLSHTVHRIVASASL